ncbi:hypothetical protein [Oryzibacter oryziterrae]|uniref:hypothetical protein n=1 Tax=Oryzibacter oryziterrae TaxID=2766474 RepID=UPI001F48CB25|nr:hypothetical protein [Oryzibacter oryziterrae]
MNGRNGFAVAILAAGLALALIETAGAACTATVTAKVPALEDDSTTVSPGDDFGTPSQLVYESDSHTSYICTEGGYCYESRGIRLKGCTLDAMPPDEGDDGSEVFFSIR